MKKFTLVLLVVLGCTKTFQSIKIADLPELKKPIQFEIQDNHLFVVDDKTIHIYSMDPFQHETRFGKPGKGKGEFQYRLMIKVVPDTILAIRSKKFDKTMYENEIYRFKGNHLYEFIQNESTGEWGLYRTKID